MKGYTKIESKFIEEINSNVTIYKHDKTNAKICTIENDDNNKVFNIAFRTPPINDGGLTHILEHSVLCGSKKYPVKDPFVELLKGSLNTFLNAFTFPDKTMYPCASQNDKDFKNIMSIYMDAVFYPQIYTHKEIFMQEGWHYHILDEKDPITYNGVVYNEMKGVFSSADSALNEKVFSSLFPDTSYRYVSGGDPKYIPDLTYEDFINFHKKYYHPSNSYIFVYGNCDMEERLKWMDEEYLSKFEAIDIDTSLKFQKPFLAPVKEDHYYQIDKDEDLDNKTYLSYNVALPDTYDNKLTNAMSILIAVLFDVPGAPVKEALIKANLADDISAYFDSGLLQPMLTIVASNSNPDKEEEFINIINEKLKEIVNKGIDKNALLSIINYFEFKTREAKFSPGMPKGIEIIMTSLNSWLYDDNMPYQKLETLKYFDEYRNEMNNGYFEDIITKYILNNNHKSYVRMLPSKTCNDEEKQLVEEKLQKYKASLSKEELDKLILENKELVKYQQTPSTKEELATIPKLKLEDLNVEPLDLKLDVIDGDYKTLVFDHPTNDIAYVKYYFDISHLSKEDTLYLSLLSQLYMQMSTDKHSYLELNQIVQNITGGLGSYLSPYYDKKNKENKLQFCLGFSALTKNVGKANELLKEIVFNTNFNDYKRLQERVNELKVQLESSIPYRGHGVSRNRALSYIDELFMHTDCIDGISSYNMISDLVKNFDGKKIVTKLNSLINSIFAKNNVTVGFTGTLKQYEELKEEFDGFVSTLNDKASFKTAVFNKNILNEGLKTQGDVNYVARVGRASFKYTGAIDVISNALSMDYLWQQIRVLGGAYGAMMNVLPQGLVSFMSYRDPNVTKTIDVYENVPKFVSEFNPTEVELTQYKIGAMGALDLVLHISDMAEARRKRYFSNTTIDDLRNRRKEIVNASVDDIRALSNIFTEALNDKALCVIGNANTLTDNKELFNNLENLNK